jgi:hypothetical protein
MGQIIIKEQMKIIDKKISRQELTELAEQMFGNFVKGVVDVDEELIALDAELHSDEESLLLDNGSVQKNLWGINIYIDKPVEERVEFDSVINLRPGMGNFSRGVEDLQIQKKITDIVNKLVE